jgi:hypothetical protein
MSLESLTSTISRSISTPGRVRASSVLVSPKSVYHHPSSVSNMQSRTDMLLSCQQMQDLAAVLLELPVSVVQGADLSGLQPAGNAVEVKCVLCRVSDHILKPVFWRNSRCKFPKPLYTPHLLLMLDLLDILCLLCVSRECGRVGQGNIHRSMMWFLQIAQLSTTMSQAHRATAFH